MFPNNTADIIYIYIEQTKKSNSITSEFLNLLQSKHLPRCFLFSKYFWISNAPEFQKIFKLTWLSLSLSLIFDSVINEDFQEKYQ